MTAKAFRAPELAGATWFNLEGSESLSADPKKPQIPTASNAVSGVGVWRAEVPDHPQEGARPAWSVCASKGRNSIARDVADPGGEPHQEAPEHWEWHPQDSGEVGVGSRTVQRVKRRLLSGLQAPPNRWAAHGRSVAREVHCKYSSGRGAKSGTSNGRPARMRPA